MKIIAAVTALALFTCEMRAQNPFITSEISYQYLSENATSTRSVYKITVKLFNNSITHNPIGITFFDKADPGRSFLFAAKPDENYFGFDEESNACSVEKSREAGSTIYYSATVSLPHNTMGYLVVAELTRPNVASNNYYTPSGFNNIALTYTASIPGYNNPNGAKFNNSPTPQLSDIPVFCTGRYLKFQFSATDADGDSLNYKFSNFLAFKGKLPLLPERPGPAPIVKAQLPPYTPLDYSVELPWNMPLGNSVSINKTTGVIEGHSPETPGYYHIALIIEEYRNKIKINEHPVSFYIRLTSCYGDARLKDSITNCKQLTLNFKNQAKAYAPTIYQWDFGVPNSITDVSSIAEPIFTFPDAGEYKVRLITESMGCTDTAYSIVRIFPGIKAAFTVKETCTNDDYLFKDNTQKSYGEINSWKWNFGDVTTFSDTSSKQNPTYNYNFSGTKTITLIAGDDKGCRDTISRDIEVFDKPFIKISGDTLICSIDTIELNAITTGSVTWSPAYNISSTDGNNIFISPDKPTTYIATSVASPRCVNSDTIFVDVKSKVSLLLPKDTSICAGDSIQLRVNSDALKFKWSPALYLNNDTMKLPISNPMTTVLYKLSAGIGKCMASDSMQISVYPYPSLRVSNDTTICFGDTATLTALTDGNELKWLPGIHAANQPSSTINVNPTTATLYTAQSKFNSGCTKYKKDSVLVTVLPPIKAFAGNDTIVVVNEPLQLEASGGEYYRWIPESGLSNYKINNPVARLQNSGSYVVKVSNIKGCFKMDTINIIVFTTAPGFFVPSAFTPNNDRLNDVLKPITAGVSKLFYFKIFNRWGQLVFATNIKGYGWDGKVNGSNAEAGVYTWIIQGQLFNGQLTSAKGIITLIR